MPYWPGTHCTDRSWSQRHFIFYQYHLVMLIFWAFLCLRCGLRKVLSSFLDGCQAPVMASNWLVYTNGWLGCSIVIRTRRLMIMNEMAGHPKVTLKGHTSSKFQSKVMNTISNLEWQSLPFTANKLILQRSWPIPACVTQGATLVHHQLQLLLN